MPLQRDFQILSDEAATREVMHSASLGRGGSGGGAWEGMGSGGGWGGRGCGHELGAALFLKPVPCPPNVDYRRGADAQLGNFLVREAPGPIRQVSRHPPPTEQ